MFIKKIQFEFEDNQCDWITYESILKDIKKTGYDTWAKSFIPGENIAKITIEFVDMADFHVFFDKLKKTDSFKLVDLSLI